MSSAVFMQAFLLIDVFFIGVIASIAVRYAYAHFHPTEPEHEAPKPHAVPANHSLPPALRERLQEEAKANFEAVMQKATLQLTRDLEATEARLTKQLEKLGEGLVDKEMDRYHKELDSLHQKTAAVGDSARDKLAEYQKELKATMEAEVAAEKQHLLTQIDTRLADAVASFLTETLQHEVDLGSQMPYLVSVLEEHKADFKREVADETRPAK